MNAFSKISKLESPYYHNLDEFNLIKEDLVNISFSFFFDSLNCFNKF